MKTNRFMNNLKRQFEENPLYAIAATAMLLTAVSKLMEANTQRSYSRTHALEVQRRVLNSTR